MGTLAGVSFRTVRHQGREGGRTELDDEQAAIDNQLDDLDPCGRKQGQRMARTTDDQTVI